MNKASLYTCFLAGFFYFASFQYYKNWGNGLSGGDPWGYYVWLPSALFYDDLTNPIKTLEARQQAFGKKNMRPLTDECFNKPAGTNGEIYLNKYTMGMAILYLPFFAIAHFLASLLGQPTDGFSILYRYWIYFNAVVYGFLGLWVLRKVLLLYFSDKITAWTVGVVAFATNLYFFATWNTGMTHAASFFLYALLLYNTEKWYANGQRINAILIGILCGLITLIRPSDVLCVFLPLLWGLYSFSTLVKRFQLVKEKWSHVLLAIVAAILTGFPQLLYWKMTAGTFFYYSYGNEGFDFSKPHLIEGIFGYKNGWLAYTPVMYLAIIGIYFLIKYRNNYLLPILTILPIQLYVIYSYWCWQWTNGFGARPMIQLYVMLSIPIAYTLQSAFTRKISTYLVIGFVFLCSVINIWQEWQFNYGMQWTELGTRNFFFSSLGKTKLTKNDVLYFDGAPWQPNIDNDAKSIKNLYFNDFETDTSSLANRTENKKNGTFGFRLDHKKEFSPGLVLENAGNELKSAKYIKVSVWCMRKHESSDLYKMSNLVTTLTRNGQDLGYYAIRLDNKPQNTKGTLWSGVPNVWEEVSYFVPIPSRGKKDNVLLKVYAWNPSDNEIFLDDLKVELY
jgi:hypothetical protein